MENQDQQFENYLGEFQPRRPRALPEPATHWQVWPRRLAAAAALTIALGASLRLVRENNELSGGEVVAKDTALIPESKLVPQPLSLLPLTRLALQAPEQLDAELARASQRVLPDFRGSESTLRVLTKE